MTHQIHGWLVVDKPSGVTSTYVDRYIKKKFCTKKIGHIGTLDPLATGVLILALGEGTKLIPFWEKFVPSIKTYEFSIQFGQETDTGDSQGTVIQACSFFPTVLDIERVCLLLHGRQNQIPPLYSALKFNGRRLCDLARKGTIPSSILTQKTRPVTIESLILKSWTETSENLVETAKFQVTCSGGTYVRSLAVDIAHHLNTLAFVTQLRRLKDRQFDENQAVPLNQIDSDKIIPLTQILPFPQRLLSDEDLLKIKSGHPIENLHNAQFSFDGFVQLMHGSCLIGIGQNKGNQCFSKRLTCNP